MQRKTLKTAFISTLPVLSGYLVLGFGFGMIANANGFSIPLTIAMSIFIYAGSMQYVAIGLLTGGASLFAIALTTLMVNGRHLFYGISMIDKYKGIGKRKPYLIFALTDETYSLVCQNHEKDYALLVTFLDHSYWILGTTLGAVIGTLVNFNSQGIEFALTALFLTVFLEQWLTSKKHAPAIIGVVVAILCLIILGSETFLIPTMLIVALILSLYKEVPNHE